MDNNTPFLRKVASFFLDETVLQETCFVFPNRRAGLFFNQYVAQQFFHPIFAPTILTIDECFHELTNLQIEPFLPLFLRFYTLNIKLCNLEQSADRFLYWGKMLLQDFSEIDNHMVQNVKELLTNIEDLQNINEQYNYLSDRQKKAISDFWGVVIQSKKNHPDSQTHDKDIPLHQFVRSWNTLYPLYQTLRQDLLAEGKAYEGMLHRHVIENWNAIPNEKKRKKYAFIAFNALTRSEEQLMLFLQKEKRATFFFDYSKNILRDPNNKTSLFIERNIQLFEKSMPISITNNDTKDILPTITAHATFSTIAQTQEVHDILMQLFPKNSQNNNFINTAIILPDEKMLLPLLQSIPEHIDKINVTMGFPIKATPLYSFIKNIQLLQDKKKNTLFYYKNVLALLSHPFVQAKNKQEVNQLLQHLQEKKSPYISASLFAEKEGLQTLFAITEDEPLATITYLREAITLYVEKNDGAKEVTLSQLNMLEDNIKKYPCLHSQKEVFLLLFTLLDTLTIPYVGEPLQGLQIMGVLESRALDFENVIFLGFNDDIYPRKLFSHSFIPMSLRKGFGLPTPERQDAIFAYNFYKIILYATNVHLIYNNATENTTSAEPSRFVWQLLMQYNTPIKKINIIPQHLQNNNKTTISIPKTDNDIAILKDKMTTEGISSSWLKNYIRCPLYFYWNHVKKITQKQEIEDIASPLEIGTLFHSIMQYLYTPLIGKELTRSDLENVATSFNQQWFAHNSTIAHLIHPIADQQLVKKALHIYVLQQIAFDQNNTPFTILSLEKEYTCPFQLNDNQTILLKGKIDRIDQTNDAIHLIDYKTGDVIPNITSVEDLFVIDKPKSNVNAFQVIFYCLLYEQNTSLTLYPYLFSLKKNIEKSKRDSMQIRVGKNKFHFQEIRPIFVSSLTHLLHSLLDKEQPFTASMTKDEKCDECPFYFLCQNVT